MNSTYAEYAPIFGEEEFQRAMDRLMESDFVSWSSTDAYLTDGISVDPSWWSQALEEPATIDPALLSLNAQPVQSGSIDQAEDEGYEADWSNNGSESLDVDDDDDQEDEAYVDDDFEEGDDADVLMGENQQEVPNQVSSVCLDNEEEEEHTGSETPRQTGYRILTHRLQGGNRLVYQVQPDPTLPPVHLLRSQATMLPDWDEEERAYWRNRSLRSKTWERFRQSGLYTNEQLALFATVPLIQPIQESRHRGVCLLCQREL